MASTITSGNATNGLALSSDNTGALQIKTGTGAGTTAMTIDSSQNVGVGTTTPARKLDVTGSQRINSGAAGTFLEILGASSDAAYISQETSSELRINQSNANANSKITFLTQGSERARVDANGNLLVTNAAGFGYGTGAGGTVTQATSKSTGVTLNTPTGKITMNGAALAANTTVSFTLTNSVIAATDVIVLNHSATGTGGAYTLNAQCSAGSAVINVRNVTAGSLSEAIVISFAVIKGATS